MAWHDPCTKCGELDHECCEVTCARCGAKGLDKNFVMEEGDEWECPPCNARCNAEEIRRAPR